jgi:hypothetical protein
MNIHYLEGVLGHYCKVFSKSKDIDNAIIDFGIIREIDTENDFLLLVSKDKEKKVKISEIVDVFLLEKLKN